jgi:hypothetical protein
MKAIASEVECDEIRYPEQGAQIRRQAEIDAKKKLQPYH